MKMPVLAGIAGALLVGVFTLPGAQALDRPGTVRITDSELRHAHVDVGTDGKSIGDLDVYTVLLYNNVRGTLTVTSLNRTSSRELLVFRLSV